jgi:hypothetical protein
MDGGCLVMRSEPIWRKLLLAIAVSSVAFPQTPSRIQSLVSAELNGMRWPNFPDYQPSLQKFYEPLNYAPVWVKGSSPAIPAGRSSACSRRWRMAKTMSP